MRTQQYAFAIADRPCGLVQSGISETLIADMLSLKRQRSQWYLVHYEPCSDRRVVPVESAEIRVWINATNPAWRDRLEDLLMEWGFSMP